MVVTFFGHRNTTQDIQTTLQKVLIDLIENKNATYFIFGNNGAFDEIVKKTVKSLKLIYPNIDYAVVLAYLPRKNAEFYCNDYSNTIFPEEVAAVPPKFAISYRNKWMIKKSDIVVVNVRHSFGGAAQFKKFAEKKLKKVINLANL